MMMTIELIGGVASIAVLAEPARRRWIGAAVAARTRPRAAALAVGRIDAAAVVEEQRL